MQFDLSVLRMKDSGENEINVPTLSYSSALDAEIGAQRLADKIFAITNHTDDAHAKERKNQIVVTFGSTSHPLVVGDDRTLFMADGYHLRIVCTNE